MSDWQFESEEGMENDNKEERRILLAVRILTQAKEAIQHALDLLDTGNVAAGAEILAELLSKREGSAKAFEELQEGRTIEGVFDGERMIGSDGQTYTVPQNYASKSRLVEGDILKLTIRKDGAFVFKQIGPIERRRVNARLAWDASAGGYVAIEGDTVWKLLTASVSYFKGQEGDAAVILVPKQAPSTWAAVEHIVHV